MRVGLVADVHANVAALDAVLAWLDAAGVDGTVCAGDLVGYGAGPDACAERVLAFAGTTVAGNHDLIATGALGTERCGPLARQSLEWTARVLRPATRARLAALPRVARGPGGVLVAHGSLDDPEHYVHTEEQAREQLRRAAALSPGAPVMVLGHTHRALVVAERSGVLAADATGFIALPPGERCLVNPGSVGQSRERRPLARAAVLDLGARTVELARVPYDVAAARRALRREGLPQGALHLPPRPVRRLAGRALRRAGLRR